MVFNQFFKKYVSIDCILIYKNAFYSCWISSYRMWFRQFFALSFSLICCCCCRSLIWFIWLTHRITATTSASPTEKITSRILINIQFKSFLFPFVPDRFKLRCNWICEHRPIDRMSVSGNFLMQYYNLSIFFSRLNFFCKNRKIEYAWEIKRKKKNHFRDLSLMLYELLRKMRTLQDLSKRIFMSIGFASTAAAAVTAAPVAPVIENYRSVPC